MKFLTIEMVIANGITSKLALPGVSPSMVTINDVYKYNSKAHFKWDCFFFIKYPLNSFLKIF